MTEVADKLGCKTNSIHSPETLDCLRHASTDDLARTSFQTWSDDIDHNIGDLWLPSVDRDFLPAPPSQLIREGRLGNASMMMGWTSDEMTPYTDKRMVDPDETLVFLARYLPYVPRGEIDSLLAFYDVDTFRPFPGSNLSATFYRTARMFRDLLMVCPTLFFAEGIHNRTLPKNGTASGGIGPLPPSNIICRDCTGSRKRDEAPAPPLAHQVYLYDFNQTLLDTILAATSHTPGLGIVHTSDLAYIHANLSNYNRNDWPYAPSSLDFDLARRVSRTWSTFAATGNPSGDPLEPAVPRFTLQGWEDAYKGVQFDPRRGEMSPPSLYVVGGPFMSFTLMDGPRAVEEVTAQKIRARCGILNGENWVEWLRY